MIELPEDDDELMGELGDLLRRVDPMPASVVAAARGALVWRTLDAERAVLASDSLLEAAAGVRGSGDRQLTFDAGSVCVEVDVVDGGERLVGQVVPPQQGHVEVEGPRTQLAADADQWGQFALRVGPGPARIRFRPLDGPVVVTDWVTL
jgi:hypothetical protein